MTLQSLSTLSTNTWYHYVVIWDFASDTGTLYLNNVSQDSKSIAGVSSPSLNHKLYIGSHSVPGSFHVGRIDDTGYWSRALTVDEIEELYNEGNGLLYPFSTNPPAELELTLNEIADNITIMTTDSLTASVVDVNETGTVSLFRNEVNVTDELDTPIYLSVGVYEYCAIAEETNTTAETELCYTATVELSNSTPLTLYINNETDAQVVTLPDTVTFSVEGSPIAEIEYIVTRDNIDVTSVEDDAITLASGTYTYKLIVPENDYYDAYNQTVMVTVLSATSGGGTNFSWEMEIDLVPGACPSNPMELMFIVLLYGFGFGIYLIGFAFNNLARPIIMALGGFMISFIPIFFFTCNTSFALLMIVAGIFLTFSSMLVMFKW